MTRLKRVIAHWTVGTHKANATDVKHYHMIVEGDGNLVEGVHKPEANIRPQKGSYAAHCLNCNTGSIGISMASMKGATSVMNLGTHPFTERQFDAMCRQIAVWCKKYDIAVSRMTVLSHAEVEPTLGIKQRGKWDITVIPWDQSIRGAIAVGDHMRQRVRYHLGGAVIGLADGPSSTGDERIRWLQRLLVDTGFDPGVPDGLIGPKTYAAIEKFQAENGLAMTAQFDQNTVKALREKAEGSFGGRAKPDPVAPTPAKPEPAPEPAPRPAPAAKSWLAVLIEALSRMFRK